MIQARKVIRVRRKTVPKLMSDFDCSEAMVWNALAFRSYSDLAESIRERALNHYGAITTKAL